MTPQLLLSEPPPAANPLTRRSQLLLDMLAFSRPGGGPTEALFIDKFIRPHNPTEDNYGNLHIIIGQPNPNILFSSHTDTVAHKEGSQTIVMNGDFAELGRKKAGRCLGGDCTTGVWIMIEMIKAKIPGLYIFHRDEEIGGKGSSYIKNQTPDVLADIDFAIAFDRKGYQDCITHQGYERTASDAFAVSIAKVLHLPYLPDDTGLFTDTANYTNLVSECSNLSIGYFDNHGPKERQDVPFANNLLDALLQADFSKLVSEREPGTYDPLPFYTSNYVPFVPAPQRSPLHNYVYQHPDVVQTYLKCHSITLDMLQEFEESYFG